MPQKHEYLRITGTTVSGIVIAGVLITQECCFSRSLGLPSQEIDPPRIFIPCTVCTPETILSPPQALGNLAFPGAHSRSDGDPVRDFLPGGILEKY